MRKILSVEVGPGTRTAQSFGDIWALTWADDDALYASTGDTTGNPEGLFGTNGLFGPGRNADVVRITGSARRPHAHTVNPMEQLLMHSEYHNEFGSWKASGMICVDSALYLVVFHHRYPLETKGFPWFTATHPKVIMSCDHGATWTRHEDGTEVTDPIRFGSPTFVQFGRNHELAEDGYVYLVSAGEGRWTNNDTYLLARTREDAITDTRRWEYCHSLAEGAPQWGPVSAATPILTTQQGLGCTPDVIFSAPTNSYILMTFSVPGLTRRPQLGGPTRDVDLHRGSSIWKLDELRALRETEPHVMEEALRVHMQTLLHVYQAPHVWGPWCHIHTGPGLNQDGYCPRLPVKWLSRSGDEARLISAGLAPEHYGLTVGTIRFELGDEIEA